MSETAVRLTSGMLRRAALVSAQLLVVFAALWALRNVTKHLSYVIIPLAVALLLTAMLEPVVGWLTRHRWPRFLAVVAALVLGLVVVGGLVSFVVFSIIDSYDELRGRVLESIGQVERWLADSPIPLGSELAGRIQDWLGGNRERVLAQALTAFNTVGAFLIGLVVALVLFIMFLHSGPRLWAATLLPWRPSTRAIIDDAGRRAYRSVIVYVRVTALVALIDAIGIGVGLLVVGVPLAVPLAALVFIGGFIPYVGAVASGFVAVAVTLVSNGLVAALIILGVVLAVQQLEGEVLQPILQGNFSNLHPTVVLVALVIGGAEGGIAGVLFAVPVLAAVRGVVLAVAEHHAAQEAQAREEKPSGTARESDGTEAPGGTGE
ncbi:AI-2E family transporter [Saccharomonospora xinjiangensis]|uniref:AI-2E family transporter n=1 Tax=Saccharomonospora xinjiangensis TaxID=75294 RepID=UPI00106F84B4|nr:AI-2E family transporter [Saccharomonospora xinjiangensis]QBQ59277.1 pheromone autoinducer 2 transporter [Saccharomonospora xinjiangensis]